MLEVAADSYISGGKGDGGAGADSDSGRCSIGSSGNNVGSNSHGGIVRNDSL